MKQKIAIIPLLWLVLTATSCHQDPSPSTMVFKGYEGNPVLVPGEPGTWDDLYVINAFEMEYQDTIYMFYSAYSKTGSRAIGLATSTDGYHFTKYEGNPILEGDGSGYDAYGVAQAQVMKADTGWVLYFNGREIAGFSSGPAFGRATATSLKGPWEKSEEPVLRTGIRGEWDSDFIYLGPLRKMEDGSYMMYYSAGEHLYPEGAFNIGMATSNDGIHWKKYNNPATTSHPFEDSDPVLTTGSPGAWDGNIVLSCDMLNYPGGYAMYYSSGAFGYAASKDGIHWKKYPKNPFYTLMDDPYYKDGIMKDITLQGAKLLFRDSLCFMYYDYGHGSNSAISMAVALLPTDD